MMACNEDTYERGEAPSSMLSLLPKPSPKSGSITSSQPAGNRLHRSIRGMLNSICTVRQCQPEHLSPAMLSMLLALGVCYASCAECEDTATARLHTKATDVEDVVIVIYRMLQWLY